jgi:hypothetical protein
MKNLIVFFLIIALWGCNSGDNSSEAEDPLVGSWQRSCSPVDDQNIKELLSDAFPDTGLWWVETLVVTPSDFLVSWNVYTDETCKTPLVLETFVDGLSFDCRGIERDEFLVQGEYQSKSLVYPDFMGNPRNEFNTCRLRTEPDLTVFYSNGVLYRAFYPSPGYPFKRENLYVDFNQTYKRI